MYSGIIDVRMEMHSFTCSILLDHIDIRVILKGSIQPDDALVIQAGVDANLTLNLCAQDSFFILCTDWCIVCTAQRTAQVYDFCSACPSQ